MGLFLTLYGALSAGFLAGAAVYLWRWKQPPEVNTEVETRIIQAPPEVSIVRCKGCVHFTNDLDRMAFMCKRHNRPTMPEAFCSCGEVENPFRYYQSNLSVDDKTEIMRRAIRGERIEL